MSITDLTYAHRKKNFILSNIAVAGKIGLIAFCGYYFAFVLSTSLFANSNEMYWWRHLIVGGTAMVSILLLPYQTIKFVFLLSPVALIYVLGGQYTYATMVLLLAISAPLFGAGIAFGLRQYGYIFPLLLTICSLIPVLENMQSFISDGFFNTNYGRERMTLGYFHPKEAAAPFLVAGILFLLFAEKYRNLIFFSLILLLWFIGSRNSFLFVIVFYYILSNLRYKNYIIALVFTATVVALLLHGDVRETLDAISSLRLTVWLDAVENIRNFDSIGLGSGERFGFDSFYVETYLLGGGAALAILIPWLLGIQYYLHRTIRKAKPYYFRGTIHQAKPYLALYVALLVFAFFDSGIASSGNLLHLFSWAIISRALTAPVHKF